MVKNDPLAPYEANLSAFRTMTTEELEMSLNGLEDVAKKNPKVGERPLYRHIETQLVRYQQKNSQKTKPDLMVKRMLSTLDDQGIEYNIKEIVIQ